MLLPHAGMTKSHGGKLPPIRFAIAAITGSESDDRRAKVNAL
jgi:hypothetical protein